jgi:hypothetical protein
LESPTRILRTNRLQAGGAASSSASATIAASRPGRTESIPRELLAAWLLFAITASAVFVTYARLPTHELYNVTGSGLTGGASRALVFLNFPTALAAIAVIALAFERLRRLRT